MIWSAVSWKWKRRRPFDSAQLFFPMKAVWKSIWKGKVPSSDSHEMREHFPCTFILKAACGRGKNAGKIESALPKAQAFFSGRKGRT